MKNTETINKSDGTGQIEILPEVKALAIAWIENYKPHNSIMPEIAQKFKLAEDIQRILDTHRLQARNLVFENNKPVADHVNETFEGLNKLTDDTEVVWWYKELIVQTVLHFTLQEREKAIQECTKIINKYFPADSSLQKEYTWMIQELEDLKK